MNRSTPTFYLRRISSFAGCLLALLFIASNSFAQKVEEKEPNRGGSLNLKSIDTKYAKDHFVVAEGYEVNLFASEEDFPLENPVSMAWDAKGRLWVATMPTYPHKLPNQPANDKIIILEDTNGDGKADKHTVFLEGLYLPLGFEFGNGGIYISQQPNILFAKDTNGDDKADVQKIVLRGFGSEDSHHAISAFTWGPGGGLYFQEGTFHHTQVETPHGTVRCENAGVFRYEPKSERFEVFCSYRFANPWGHVFDQWGQNFIADASGGANYFGAPITGHLDFPMKHSRMKVFTSIVRPTAGCEIVSSRHFPQEAQGNFLVNNNIGFQGVKQHRMIEEGSGFTSKELEPLIYSKDMNFRPVDLQFGPDGALYIVDWFNPLIGHMQYSVRDKRRDKRHGRIWRITHKGSPLLTPPKIAGEPIAKLLELLKTPEDRTRYAVRRELRDRNDDEVVKATHAWLKTLDPNESGYEHHMLEALWVMQGAGNVDVTLLNRVLNSPEPKARAAATRVVGYWRHTLPDPLAMLAKSANDKHPRVRLEAVRACSFFRNSRAAEVALESLRYPTDYYLQFTRTETMRQLEQFYLPDLKAGKPFASTNPLAARYVYSKIATEELTALPRNESVCLALLTRAGVPEGDRRDAISFIARAKKIDELSELLIVLHSLDQSSETIDPSVLNDLTGILSSQPAERLRAKREDLVRLATSAKQDLTRQVGFAALIAADETPDPAWTLACRSPQGLVDMLHAIPLVSNQSVRGELYDDILACADTLPQPIQKIVGSLSGVQAQYVRISLPGKKRTLTLAEVEVYSNGKNIAPMGKASQSSTTNGGNAKRAIDKNKSGNFSDRGQTHTRQNNAEPWWELNLRTPEVIEGLVIYNRTDGQNMQERLAGYRLELLDAKRQVIFRQENQPAPSPSTTIATASNWRSKIHRAAISALPYLPGHDKKTFEKLLGMYLKGEEQASTIAAISHLRSDKFPKKELHTLASAIVEHVERTPAAERTKPAMLQTIQLGKTLARLLPKEQAAPIRSVLKELGVELIVMRPVPKLVRFDRKEIAVEAGRPVEIVFENVDVMQHNMVIGKPGSFDSIVAASLKLQQSPLRALKRGYVPRSSDVLWATPLLQAGETARLKFIAPKKPGKYPYVCTYPAHDKTMNGIMHVVPNLDTFLAKYEMPDPEISHAARTKIIKYYRYDKLKSKVNWELGSRTFAVGKRMFTEMTCASCHKMDAPGNLVGPNLAREDLKQTRQEILLSMVEPSYKIDKEFLQWVFIANGKPYSGLLLKETKEYYLIDEQPGIECAPTKIYKEDLEDDGSPKKSKYSAMPDKLLNTMTEEELLDLVAYVHAKGDPNHRWFTGTPEKKGDSNKVAPSNNLDEKKIYPKMMPDENNERAIKSTRKTTESSSTNKNKLWLELFGKTGPGKGKHVVLVSGDEEYRSEELMPQLAKILSAQHGFDCTVLFAINPKDGTIDPNQNDNIPGLEALQKADLMIIATRFRNLPDEQMKFLADYIESGKPILGMRTATHAFNIPNKRKYAKYGWKYKGKEYSQGFGRQVLGETWINHHGRHGHESTRGIIASDRYDHPILRGIKSGRIWGKTDVYGVRLPLPKNCKPLLLGQVLDGMKPDSKPVNGKKKRPYDACRLDE